MYRLAAAVSLMKVPLTILEWFLTVPMEEVLEKLLKIPTEQVLESFVTAMEQVLESLPTAPMESQVSVTLMIALLERVS